MAPSLCAADDVAPSETSSLGVGSFLSTLFGQTQVAPAPAAEDPSAATTDSKSAPGGIGSENAEHSPRSKSRHARGRAVDPAMKALVTQHASANGLPLGLAHAIVMIESRYNPHVRNHGALGLMQIKAQTARTVGFTGADGDLLNAETNLKYGMRYLAMIYRAAGGDVCGTIMRYQSGHLSTHLTAANRAYCARAQQMMAGA